MCATDWHRQQAGRDRTLPDGGSPDAQAAADRRERAEAVVAACDELRSPLREVFWLRKVQGLSAQEVAELTGLATSTVHAYVSQACTGIRRQLARSYPELRGRGVARDD